MNSAVIVAGGTGSRFGDKIPKQFIKVRGLELLAYSVNTFTSHNKIDEVIIVSHKDWIKHVSKNYPHCKVVQGGLHRQESSLNGVISVSKKTNHILIHDAARPLVSHEIISNCLSALNNADVSVPILEPSSSLVKWDGKSVKYIDRSTIYVVQTPQCFKKNILLSSLHSNIIGTDELGIVIKKFPQIKIKFIQGALTNFKITTKLDLVLFNSIQP